LPGRGGRAVPGDQLLGGVGVEVAVAAPGPAERHVHVDPEGALPEPGEGGCGQGAVGRDRLTVEHYRRHASSLGHRRRCPGPAPAGYPLTAPEVSPSAMCRWRYQKTARTGAASSRVPAANIPKLASRWSATGAYSRCATVLESPSRRQTLAMMTSLTVAMKTRSPTMASTGAASGSRILKNSWACEALSTRAASSSSAGTVSKKPFISQVLMLSAPPR